MSIRQVQIKNALDFVTQAMFISGVNPLIDDILKYISYHFSEYPTGLPIKIDLRDLSLGNGIIDPELLNEVMAKMIVNVDTLYESTIGQLEQTLMINTILRTHLERLKIKQRTLSSQVDDYLLGLFNSDGYFYSVSESFSDISNTDLSLTSCYIDTEAGVASLPIIAGSSQGSLTKSLSEPRITAVDSNGNPLIFNRKTNFTDSTDGLTNTAWFFTVDSDTEQLVVATLTFSLFTAAKDTKLSKIDVDPYGVSPLTMGIDGTLLSETYINSLVKLSDPRTITNKSSFVIDIPNNNTVNNVTFNLSKTKADFTRNDNGKTVYTYIFGFKEISMTSQVFDRFATYVSRPFSLPEELLLDHVIHAVSISSTDFLFDSTSIQYYVARDDDSAAALDDFDWKEIVPIGTEFSSTQRSVVNFEGATKTVNHIKKTPTNNNDLQLIALDSTNIDLTKRNPTPAIVPDSSNIYRITSFEQTPLTNTMKIEEGINTTRIYSVNADDYDNNDFNTWKNILDDQTAYQLSYGTIDAGYQFFYGGDVGESNRYVFAETYLDVDEFAGSTILKECKKSDENSKLWDIKIYLNGKIIANMPVGTDLLTVPWKFLNGKNHVALLINIPEATVSHANPYIGSLNIMKDSNIYEFGIVKLSDWTYVDFYKFSKNLLDNTDYFTIYNKEIISRKQPTDNLRLTYLTTSTQNTTGVRVRIDMARGSDKSRITPMIDSYRIRFAY